MCVMPSAKTKSITTIIYKTKYKLIFIIQKTLYLHTSIVFSFDPIFLKISANISCVLLFNFLAFWWLCKKPNDIPQITQQQEQQNSIS